MSSSYSPHRRRLLAGTAGATALLLGMPAPAQRTRIVKLVVPVPAGGGMDATARLTAEHLKDALGTVIVDNRPGAALRLALHHVKDAPGDGSTLLYTSVSPFTIYPHVYKRPGYDAETTLIPVAPVVTYDFALGVPGDSAISSLSDYLDAVRKDPATMDAYAVPAAGSAPHFAGAALATAAGVTLKHIPYKGSAPAVQDLIGNHVPACFNVLGEFLPYRASGKIRILATTGAQRSPLAPDTPTFAESGFGTLVFDEQFGLFAPAGTPTATIVRINEAVTAAMRKAEVRQRLAEMGYTPAAMSPGVFADKLRQDRATWGPLVKASGFTLDE